MANFYRGKLRKLITDQMLINSLRNGRSNIKAAMILSTALGVPVSRQNVEYWRKGIDAAEGKAATSSQPAANRALVKERVLRVPSVKDYAAEVKHDNTKIYNNILVMPDLHAPYHHKDALDFIRAVRDKYIPDLVVNLGDEVDNHALSFHDSDPNLKSASGELAAARLVIKELHDIFPSKLICHSNHGSLHYRRAKAHGIPVEYLRTYREILFPTGGGANWDWNYSHTVLTDLGPVHFKHQCSGPAVNAAAHEGCNVIVGHNHGSFEVSYKASRQRLYYGATVGCLIDRTALAFAYGKETGNKPMLGAMMIVNGVPNLIPMVIDTDGNWIGTL